MIPTPFPPLRWWIEPEDLQTTCGKHFKNQQKKAQKNSHPASLFQKSKVSKKSVEDGVFWGCVFFAS